MKRFADTRSTHRTLPLPAKYIPRGESTPFSFRGNCIRSEDRFWCAFLGASLPGGAGGVQARGGLRVDSWALLTLKGIGSLLLLLAFLGQHNDVISAEEHQDSCEVLVLEELFVSHV